MKIAEHYSRARNTSNLKSSELTIMSASDVLGAAGMAAQQHSDALLLWSVVYGGKTQQKMMLVDGLERKVCDYMMRNRLKGNPRHIAMEVLAYYLHATCKACDGVGYQVIEGTITRSDDPCDVCGGSGKPHPPNGDAWQWLHRYVGELISIAAGRMMQKISLDL
jgi:hypothetical protein